MICLKQIFNFTSVTFKQENCREPEKQKVVELNFTYVLTNKCSYFSWIFFPEDTPKCSYFLTFDARDLQ